MRRFAGVIMLSAWLALAASPADATIIEILPADQSAQLGDPVAVDIVVDTQGVSLIGAFDFIVGFDDSILSVLDVEFGNGLGGPFDSLQDAFDLGSGMLNLAELSFVFDLSPLQSGAFTLATITFDTVGVGISAIDLSPNILGYLGGDGLIGDDLGFPIDATVVAGQVTVTDNVVPVSEPPLLLLLASGLGLLIAHRKVSV